MKILIILTISIFQLYGCLNFKSDTLRQANSYPDDPNVILELSVMEYIGKDKFDDMFSNNYRQFKSYDAYIVRDVVTGKNTDLLVLTFHKGKPLLKINPSPETTYTVH